MARVRLSSPNDPWVHIFFRAPRSFRDALHKEAARRGMSLSSFIRSVLLKEVDWQPKEGGHGSGEAD